MPETRGRNTGPRAESDDKSTVNSRITLVLCAVLAYVLMCIYALRTMSSSGSRHPTLTRQEKRDRRLVAIIAKSVEKAVSDVYENVIKSSEGSQAEAPKDSSKTAFSFKQFKACVPKEFTGKDGPTAMFHWFDSIEVTLRQSGCPGNLHTLNATGVFQSRALDWWTAERNKRGDDASYELTWKELKAIMIDEFCPPHER
ncbi:hypothetical protein Hanom_Chr09g00827591 [Helianthus anomalus]